MKHTALFYKKINKNKIQCTLCPHECILNLNQTGICKTRKNIDSKLITLAYSNPVAIATDPVEKKPLYHFLPGSKTLSLATAGCNLSCLNCQNYNISQKSPIETQNYHLEPDNAIEIAIKYACNSISYTYTDPIVFFEYTIDIAQKARQKNLKNIIVSAGYINPKPLEQLSKYIDAANIDIKSFDEKLYRKINKASLKPVLKTLEILKKNNIWLEITYLLIPGLNDSETMLNKFTKWLVENGFTHTPLHFSRFYPTYKMTNKEITPLKTINTAINIAKSNGMIYLYGGNITGHKSENTYCPNCGKKIIERYGYNIITNNISDNKCKFCGTKIDGIW